MPPCTCTPIPSLRPALTAMAFLDRDRRRHRRGWIGVPLNDPDEVNALTVVVLRPVPPSSPPLLLLLFLAEHAIVASSAGAEWFGCPLPSARSLRVFGRCASPRRSCGACWRSLIRRPRRRHRRGWIGVALNDHGEAKHHTHGYTCTHPFGFMPPLLRGLYLCAEFPTLISLPIPATL